MDIPVKGPNHDWIAYRLLVINMLDTIELDVSLLQEEQLKIRLDIRELRTKAAIWGGVTGAVLSLFGVLLNLLLG